MGRWAPDAKGRLGEAAMELFVEQGYDAVTVADIAARAGLSKRTFFNHYADKCEVLFAAADEFTERIVAALLALDHGLEPLDAALAAYAQGSQLLVEFPELVKQRAVLLASSQELRERDLMKMASLTGRIATALVERGADEREASFAAQAATSIYNAAVVDWTTAPDRSIEEALQSSLREFRAAVAV